MTDTPPEDIERPPAGLSCEQIWVDEAMTVSALYRFLKDEWSLMPDVTVTHDPTTGDVLTLIQPAELVDDQTDIFNAERRNTIAKLGLHALPDWLSELQPERYVLDMGPFDVVRTIGDRREIIRIIPVDSLDAEVANSDIPDWFNAEQRIHYSRVHSGIQAHYDRDQQVMTHSYRNYRVRHLCPPVRRGAYGAIGRHMIAMEALGYENGDGDMPATLTSEAPTDESAPYRYRIQANTHDRKLRDLSSHYPREVTNGVNYQTTTIHALGIERRALRTRIEAVRKLEFLASIKDHATRPSHREMLERLAAEHFRRNLIDQLLYEANDFDITSSDAYIQYRNQLDTYRARRAVFVAERERFGAKQAEYYQRAAMIRQIPFNHVDIIPEHILNTIKQWPNVFGFSAYKDPDGYGYFWLTIGLCDIIMAESAENPAYDDNHEYEFRLAPFYINIRIDEEGRITVPTANVRGLSRSRNQGGLGSDIHPHQLSDSPCFGSFGQSLIDAGNEGDMVAVIAILISFYSQYNSDDSAGNEAYMFHPCQIARIADPDDYFNAFEAEFTQHDSVLNWFAEDKLREAIDDYQDWHGSSPPYPERVAIELCYNCNEDPVGDRYTTHYTANDNPICDYCWNENYCHDCEQHHEDCTCERDEY